MKEALVIVDMQRDFMPGGSLPVPDGDKIVPRLNEYVKLFTERGAKVFATKDWHPPNHKSFKEHGGPWPRHCVQGTEGAELHPDLKLPEDAEIVLKATKPDEEAYSAFQGTDFASRLRELGIDRIYVGGVATEYCVKATVLDGLKLGFEVYLLLDAIKGVRAEDAERAIEEMKGAGAKPITLSQLKG